MSSRFEMRLLDEDEAALGRLVARLGVNQTWVIRQLIRAADRGEGVDLVRVGPAAVAQVPVSEDARAAPVAGHVVAPSGAGRKMVDAGVKRDSYPGWMKGKK